MVAISVVAGAIYVWPQYVVNIAGTNAIWSLLTTALVALSVMALQLIWVHFTKATPYAVMVRQTWGRVGEWVAVSITGILCLILDGIMLALFGEMLHVFFYPMTPEFVMMGLINLSAVWIAIRPLSTVARNVQFWFPIVLMSFLLILGLSVRNIRFLSAVVPSTTVVIPQWFKASLGVWFLYANGAVVASMVPHIRWSNRPRPVLWTAMAIGFQTLILMVVFVVVVGTLGSAGVAQLQWPMIYVFSLVSVRTFFFKGVGMFVVITWAAALVLYLAVHFFCFSWSVQAMVGASTKTRQWIVVGAGIMVFIVALLIPSSVAAGKILFGFMNPVDLSWTLAVVVPSVMVAWIRQRRNKAQ